MKMEEQIKDYLLNNPYIYDWGYDDYIPDHIINKATSIEELKDMMLEICYDWSDYDIFEYTLKDQFGDKLDDIDISEFYEYFIIDYNIEELINKQDINVRFEMLSNYDCINSHWFEGGYEGSDSYYSDCIKILELNPYDVKQLLDYNDIVTYGEWNNIECDPIVSLKDFLSETIDRTCPACLLTLACNIPLTNLYDTDFIISKDTPFGFFSSSCGGGSIFDGTTIRDYNLSLKEFNFNNPVWRIVPEFKENGYSINDVYGMSYNFYKKVKNV